MIGHAEHTAAFTFIFLTFALTLNQGQGQKRSCSLFSRPHPNGLCGPRLALAHENLCFLIRQNYPQFFPLLKRVETKDTIDQDDVSVPPIDSDDDDAGVGSGQDDAHNTPSSSTKHNSEVSGLVSPDKSQITPEDVTASAFLHILAKRSPVTKRSLLCDCCYGPCSTRTLARYC